MVLSGIGVSESIYHCQKFAAFSFVLSFIRSPLVIRGYCRQDLTSCSLVDQRPKLSLHHFLLFTLSQCPVRGGH